MKTPKEKAIELVDKMYNTEHCGIEHFPNKHYCECSEINLYQAKQCAIIAVDRNIKMLNEFLNTMDGWMHEAKCAVMELIENEEELKQEIEKL